MRALWSVLLLASCIQSNLTPCGDLVCPAGDLCLEDTRCVSPGQLVSCADSSTGDTCTVDGIAGQCIGGACVPIICGNGDVDPGETCDDGNQISGDGCNGTCASLEICGNGIVDLASGEACDCGVGADASTLCMYPNSDEPSAECTLDCKPRFCGDDQINTIEQCDGSLPTDITCADYGFYRGEPTCSGVCQISPASCEGRCGDGTVDTDFGEVCDMAPPPGASCQDFGMDLGTVHCGTGCGPALDTCGRLTWTRAHQVVASVGDLWAGNGKVGVVYATGDAYVRYQETWSKATGSYNRITGSATAVWAIGATSVSKWMAATGWVQVTPPWPGTIVLGDAWASDVLGLFVSEIGTTTVQRYIGGAWTTIEAPAEGAAFESTRTNLWIAGGLGGTGYGGSEYGGIQYGELGKAYDGSNWSVVPAPGIESGQRVTEDTTGRLWASTYGGTYRTKPSGWETIPFWVEETFWSDGDGAIAAASSGDGISTYSWLQRYDNPPLVLGYVPTSESGVRIAADDTGVVYAVGNDGLYSMRHGAWRTLDGDRSGIQPPVVDGDLIEVNNGIAQRLDEHGEWSVLPLPAIGCGAVMRIRDTTIAACPAGLYVGSTLAVPGMEVQGLWSSGKGPFGAVGGFATGPTPDAIVWSDGTTWTTIPTPERFWRVYGDRADELYALNSQNELYRYDGSSWSLLAEFINSQVTVTPTRVVVQREEIWLQYNRTTGIVMPLDVPLMTRSIGGMGGEELFAIAPPPVTGSPLYRWDGNQWSNVRVTSGVDNGWVRGLYPFKGDLVMTQAIAAEPPTYFHLQRTGAW